MMKHQYIFYYAVFAFFFTGCMMYTNQQVNYSSSVIDYLYPNQSVVVTPSIPKLHLPLKVGIAFLPEKEILNSLNVTVLSEKDRSDAIQLVKREFLNYDYIGSIEIIPSSYLVPKGGFTNLDFVADLFDIDIVVLISFDQHQYTKENPLALAYLSIIGMYVIPGDINDTCAMVDATVYHISSRKLLFRAPGVSKVNGISTLINLNTNLRNDRKIGFNLAVQNMIPNLKEALKSFKDKMKETPEDYEVTYRPGYTGGGILDPFILLTTFGAIFCVRKYRKK